jgi:hypothetical protein
MNALALLAAGAASAVTCAHAVVGQRWFVAQLGSLALQPTRPWGDADVTRRVFAVTWHIGTAYFAASAVALYLAGLEAVESHALLRFISIVYAASVAIGVAYLRERPRTLARPFAAVVVTCLLGVAVLAWLAQVET